MAALQACSQGIALLSGVNICGDSIRELYLQIATCRDSETECYGPRQRSSMLEKLLRSMRGRGQTHG